DPLKHLTELRQTFANPVIHGVANHQPHAPNLIQHLHLHDRVDISQKNVLRIAVAIRQLRHKTRKDVQVQLQGVAHVDVLVISPAPVKSIAPFALDSFEIDPALGKKLEVLLGKILTDDPDDTNRSKKTRRQREVGSRTAQDPLCGAEGSFDGIECHRADNQNAHRYLPIMGFRLARTFLGMRVRSVMIASLSDDSQPQDRASDSAVTTRRIVLCASSTFCCKTFKTCSISTFPTASFQQS